MFLLIAKGASTEGGDMSYASQDWNKTTTNTSIEIKNELLRAGVTPQGVKLALAHARAESFQGGTFKSKGYNYWNFGRPTWWGEFPISTRTGLADRPNDDVGKTISFASLADAVLGYLEIMRRGRPTAYRQLMSIVPNVDSFCRSLCPAQYGDTGNNYATACNTHYVEAIKTLYLNA